MAVDAIKDNSQTIRTDNMKNHTNKRIRQPKWCRKIEEVQVDEILDGLNDIKKIVEKNQNDGDRKKRRRVYNIDQKKMISSYANNPKYIHKGKIQWYLIEKELRSQEIFIDDDQGLPDRVEIRNCYVKFPDKNSTDQELQESLEGLDDEQNTNLDVNDNDLIQFLNTFEQNEEDRRINEIESSSTSAEHSSKFSKFVNLYKNRSHYNSANNVSSKDISNYLLPKADKKNYTTDEFDLIEWVSNDSFTKTNTGNQISWSNFIRIYIHRKKNFHMMDNSLQFFDRNESSIIATAKKHLQNINKN